MGRKQSWHNAAQRVPRVGTFYHNVSYTTASHVRDAEPESREER